MLVQFESCIMLNAIDIKFGQKLLGFVGTKLLNNLLYLIKIIKDIHSLKKTEKNTPAKILKFSFIYN